MRSRPRVKSSTRCSPFSARPGWTRYRYYMASKVGFAAVGAWLLVSVYYFFQYALRSCPSGMMPQLSEAFGVNALGVSAIVGMFYYGYSPFSLVAGTSMDRFGAKRVIPIGAAVVGIGAILFGTGNVV